MLAELNIAAQPAFPEISIDNRLDDEEEGECRTSGTAVAKRK